jgi:hypothetical protein
MSVPVPLRGDFDAPQLRGLEKKSAEEPRARRLLALAAIYDGATRTEAAKIRRRRALVHSGLGAAGSMHVVRRDCATGQRKKITRRRAKSSLTRGTRPSALRDQGTASTASSARSRARVRPNTEAMNLHLAEIAKIVWPCARAVLLVDQAGWHLSTHLTVPPNITITAQPPKSLEFNPVENGGPFMRDN